jgi:hypothetical protein
MRGPDGPNTVGIVLLAGFDPMVCNTPSDFERVNGTPDVLLVFELTIFIIPSR